MILDARESSTRLPRHSMYRSIMLSKFSDRTGSVLLGAAGGAAAYLVGLLVTFVTAGIAAASLSFDGPLSGTAPGWKTQLWVFYDAHFVGTQTASVFGPDGTLIGGGELFNTIDLLGVEYLYAVPILVLVAAGAVVASVAGASDPYDGLRAGMGVTAGYVAMVVLGLLAAVHLGTGPSPLRAVVIAGIVYPVAFGSLGGFIVGYRNRETSDEWSDPVEA